jgi:TRAP-type C4-dicarboxylate transport system permease small subunit
MRAVLSVVFCLAVIWFGMQLLASDAAMYHLALAWDATMQAKVAYGAAIADVLH